MSDDAKDSSDNRRRFERKSLSVLVQYRLPDFAAFMKEYSMNISVGGMFIKTSEPREEGAMIYLQFYLQDGEKLIEGLGRVVHVNDPATSGEDAGMGVEFVNFDDESTALIEQIVNSRGSGTVKN